MFDSEIYRHVRGQFPAVRDITSSAQSIPIQEVNERESSHPIIRNAGRTGERLIVIGENIMILDVSQIARIEVELGGLDVRRFLLGIGEISEYRPAILFVCAREFHTVYGRFPIIKWCEDQGRTELAIVQL